MKEPGKVGAFTTKEVLQTMAPAVKLNSPFCTTPKVAVLILILVNEFTGACVLNVPEQVSVNVLQSRIPNTCEPAEQVTALNNVVVVALDEC